MRRLVLLILIAALGGLTVSLPGDPAGASSLNVEAVIWQFGRDYPGAEPDDVKLPIKTVYIKTHDGTDWMSTYDSHPRAVSGPDALRSLIRDYSYQGIDVVAWFVPYGTDIEGQLQRAREVIDAGVKGLVADVEPYSGFCAQDCPMLAEQFWKPLRAQRPNASLGVTYDPRSWWLGPAAIPAWLSVADMAAPECYWESFAGQGAWGDPGSCLLQAHADLVAMTPGRNVEFAPMLQGDSNASSMRMALDTSVALGAGRVSLWRRGVVPSEVWNEITAYVGEPNRPCWVTRSDNCLIRETSDQRVWLMEGGARFPVPGTDVLNALGYRWEDVHVVPDGFANLVPLIPRDGTLLSGDGPVYVVYAGAHFWVPDPDTFNALGLDWGAVRVLPPGAISQIPAVPDDYRRFAVLGGVEQFTVVHGKKFQLDPVMLEMLQRAGVPAYTLWPGALDAFPGPTLRFGDVSCNEAVDAVDALDLLRSVAGLPNLGICGHVVGDVDCDGDQDTVDALKILRWVAGLEAVAVPAPSVSPAPGVGATSSAPAICVNIGSSIAFR